MRTRWKMARERKKKDIPESNQKRRKKENIFDIWSTFSSFSEEKKVKLIHFWIDRATLHFFFVVVLSWFCCLWREKINPTENEETRTRGERREKKTLHDTIVVSHLRRALFVNGLMLETSSSSALGDFGGGSESSRNNTCLLYTSDAADE